MHSNVTVHYKTGSGEGVEFEELDAVRMDGTPWGAAHLDVQATSTGALVEASGDVGMSIRVAGSSSPFPVLFIPETSTYGANLITRVISLTHHTPAATEAPPGTPPGQTWLANEYSFPQTLLFDPIVIDAPDLFLGVALVNPTDERISLVLPGSGWYDAYDKVQAPVNRVTLPPMSFFNADILPEAAAELEPGLIRPAVVDDLDTWSGGPGGVAIPVILDKPDHWAWLNETYDEAAAQKQYVHQFQFTPFEETSWRQEHASVDPTQDDYDVPPFNGCVTKGLGFTLTVDALVDALNVGPTAEARIMQGGTEIASMAASPDAPAAVMIPPAELEGPDGRISGVTVTLTTAGTPGTTTLAFARASHESADEWAAARASAPCLLPP